MNNSRLIEKNFLTKSDFLHCLRLEKRRVDRSKVPLSIALFCFKEEEMTSGALKKFLEILHGNTRETDIKGWLERGVIGLLLPDTNEKGVKRFAEKIINGNGSLNYSVITRTYPDHLFQVLLADEKTSLDIFPFDMDVPLKHDKFQLVIKRGMDIIGAFFGLLVVSPIILIAAIAVKLTSPGPIIFKQSRLGMKGARFPFLKFRSMYWNVDDRIHREYITDLIGGDLDKINQGDATEPIYKMKSDPRVTKVGKIIRKSSIDELPQLFNVLRGEMSLVGPRPPIPYEVEKYEPWHLRRILEVKPGITGLWQVDGRSKTSFDDMVRLDLRYAQNWSLWLDVKILLKTVKAVLRPSGAL